MKFRFKLERLLSLIRIKETMKKLEVAAVLRRVALIKKRQAEIRASIQAMLGSSGETGILDLSMITYKMKKIELDRVEEQKLDQTLRETNKELSKFKNELNRLSVRRKGLEAIRDKRLAEFKLEQSRHAQKELDEAYELTRKVA